MIGVQSTGKRIIICCDGTANAALAQGAVPTNIQRISELTLPMGSDGKLQVTHYHPGVGTPVTDKESTGSVYDQMLGRNVDLHVKELYKFLVDNYIPGDEIYCFGFSRGAFTVRTLLGLLKHFGILNKNGYGEIIDTSTTPHTRTLSYYDATVINAIYELYRSGDCRDGTRLPREIGQSFYPEIQFLGVFDTVKALPAGNEFHDITLYPHIKMARHALAIDEQRIDFKPCMWNPKEGMPDGSPLIIDSQQMWFVGAHADIGGGYGGEEKSGRGLSNIALHWMLNEAGTMGLTYNKDSLALYAEGPIEGEIHDELSATGDNAFGATSTPYTKPVATTAAVRPESFKTTLAYKLRGRVFRHICAGVDLHVKANLPAQWDVGAFLLVDGVIYMGGADKSLIPITLLEKMDEVKLAFQNLRFDCTPPLPEQEKIIQLSRDQFYKIAIPSQSTTMPQEIYSSHRYYPTEGQGRWHGIPNTHTFGDPQVCNFTDVSLSLQARKRIEEVSKPYTTKAFFDSTLASTFPESVRKKLRPTDLRDALSKLDSAETKSDAPSLAAALYAAGSGRSSAAADNTLG